MGLTLLSEMALLVSLDTRQYARQLNLPPRFGLWRRHSQGLRRRLQYYRGPLHYPLLLSQVTLPSICDVLTIEGNTLVSQTSVGLLRSSQRFTGGETEYCVLD